MKPLLRVLIGVNDDVFRDPIMALISEQFASRYAIKVKEISYSEQLLQVAEERTYDLAIVRVNNLMTRTGRDRLKETFRAVGQAKKAHKNPLVVFDGFGVMEYTTSLEESGVKIILTTPCTGEEFKNAFDWCLAQVSNASANG